MSKPRIVLHPEIRAALDDCGVSWSVENGAKHAHLYVEGKLIAVIDRKGDARTTRMVRNAVAVIRRVAR